MTSHVYHSQIDENTLARIRRRLDEAHPETVAAVPPRTLEGIRDFVLLGIPTGDFLQAVLSNDLMHAVSRADKDNRVALADIVTYIVSYCPANCWTSQDRYFGWLDSHRKLREDNEAESVGPGPQEDDDPALDINHDAYEYRQQAEEIDK